MVLCRSLHRNCKRLVVLVTAITSGFMIWSVSVSPPELPIFVVEEHHEVIKYWFEAAESGLIPKTGNVLVHIDGHADEAMPSPTEGYSPFDWPKTPTQLRYLMRENDEFIQAAIMTGLISKFIWVWPTWDSEDNEGYEDDVGTVELGVVTISTAKGPVTYHCECRWEGKGKRCNLYNHTLDDEDTDEKEGEVAMNPNYCTVKVTYSVHYIREDHLWQKMDTLQLASPGQSVLLDIDEDFFGVESAYKRILNSSVSKTWIKKVDKLISRLLCPANGELEQAADHVLYSIIRLILRTCKWVQNRCKLTSISVGSLAKKLNENFMRIGSHIYCYQTYLRGPSPILRDMLLHLLMLTRQQLIVLADTGFCLETTPKGHDFQGKFHVCHGLNQPDDPLLTWHTPTPRETDLRATSLSQYLSKHLVTPKLITVARSVRDGYTPRSFFNKIEDKVLRIVSRSHQNEVRTIYFDKDLLGGKQGWPWRRR